MRKGQPKGKAGQDEPSKEISQEEKSQNSKQEDYAYAEKTLVQRAVQLGLITIPLVTYVSWAYRKFFPCPRVKPIPTPKKFKLKPKRSFRAKFPGFSSAIDLMKKRYCTNKTIMKPALTDNRTNRQKLTDGLTEKKCRTRLAQENKQDVDPCEMLRYDVRDEGYDRAASAKSRKPFASFYEDDFREEVDAYRQEQVYTKDRYRERQRLPERKNRLLKDNGSASKQEDSRGKPPYDQTMWMEADDCASAKVQKGLQGGRNQDLNQINQIKEGPSNSSITYCEYLKRPTHDYDHPENETNSKKNGRSNKPSEKQNLSKALVVNNAESLSNDSCIETIHEDYSQTSKHYLATSGFNITPEIMDSLCQQCIREFQNTSDEKEENERQDLTDRDERTKLKEQEMNQSNCCCNCSTIDSSSEKSKRGKQDNENAKDEDNTTNHDIGDACNKDKYMQEVKNRLKKSTASSHETSPGEKDFKKIANVKPNTHDDLCGVDFHSKNSDTPYVVKNYTCKSNKSKKIKGECGDDATETFEHRQHKFWHSCNPPKGLRKGCRMSPDNISCD